MSHKNKDYRKKLQKNVKAHFRLDFTSEPLSEISMLFTNIQNT